MKCRRWTECLIELLIDALISFGILLAATLISLALSKIHDDNNTFSMSLYILAVALIARFTHGYIHGIVASLVSVVCVNHHFHPSLLGVQHVHHRLSAHISFDAAGVADHQHADQPDQAAGAASLRNGSGKDARKPSALRIARSAHAAGFDSGRELGVDGRRRQRERQPRRDAAPDQPRGQVADSSDGEPSVGHALLRPAAFR